MRWKYGKWSGRPSPIPFPVLTCLHAKAFIAHRDLDLSKLKRPALRLPIWFSLRLQHLRGDSQNYQLLDKVNSLWGTGIIMKVITNGSFGRLNWVCKWHEIRFFPVSVWIVKYQDVLFRELCQAIIFIFYVAMHIKLSTNKEERKKRK